eukprot:4605629-Pyramimonas_sp.AAC.1
MKAFTVGPRCKIEVGSGRVPWCSSCLLDCLVHPGEGHPRAILWLGVLWPAEGPGFLNQGGDNTPGSDNLRLPTALGEYINSPAPFE